MFTSSVLADAKEPLQYQVVNHTALRIHGGRGRVLMHVCVHSCVHVCTQMWMCT